MTVRRAMMLTAFLLLAIYLLMMADNIFWRDSMEFALIGHHLDIGHPAGSPTFALVAKLLSFLPLGNLAWRANLVSVLGAVAAVLLLWAAAAKWIELLLPTLGKTAWAWGAGAVAAFAFSHSFWAWSEVAEVYSAQAALLAGLLWLTAVALRDEPDVRMLGIIGLMLGLSCGVHMVQILYVPAFALALLIAPPRRIHWRGLAAMASMFLLGFSVFVYLPIRSATDLPYDHGNPETWNAFVAHITGRTYAYIVHSFPWARIGHDLSVLPGHIVRELNPLLAAAALLGLYALARKRARALAMVLLLTAGHLYLYVKDWDEAFGYIPLYLLAAWTGAIGLACVGERLAAKLGGKAVALPVALAVAMGAWGFSTSHTYCNRASHDLAYRHGRAILDSLPTGAVLVGYQDHLSYNAFYQQSIERWRDDVQFLHRVFLHAPAELQRRFPAWDLRGYDPEQPLAAQALLLHNGGAGVYWDFGWETVDYIETSCLSPYGLVFRLTPAGETTVGDQRDVALWRDVFAPLQDDPVVALHGYDWTAREVYGRAHHLRAKYFLDTGQAEAAMAEAQEALRINETLAEYRTFIGLLLLAQKQVEPARDQLRRAVADDPLCDACLDGYAQYLLFQKQYDRAGAMLRRAYALNPNRLSTALNLLRLCLQSERWAEAAQIVRASLPLARAENDRFLLHLYGARAYIGMNDFPQACRQAHAAQALRPADEQAALLAKMCAANLEPKKE